MLFNHYYRTAETHWNPLENPLKTFSSREKVSAVEGAERFTHKQKSKSVLKVKH